MKKQIIYITNRGAAKLQEQIQALNARIAEIQAEKAVAYWGSGDGWHDNPGFNQLEQLEHRTINAMVELKNRLNNAIIWDPSKNAGDKVQIGTEVTFVQRNLKTGQKVTLKLTIVGFQESDLRTLQISYDSPIGTALLNHKSGETVEYTIPAGHFEALILNIKDKEV